MKYRLVLLLCFVMLNFSYAQNCEAGFRLITNASEPVCIPENLERVVALDEGTMTDLLALGVQPVAVMDWGNRDYAQYLRLEPGEIKSVGTSEGPNYEAMLSLNPDLIVGRGDDLQSFSGNALESLQAVAPTVLSETAEDDFWRSHFQFLGDVFDKEAEVQALLSSYETRLQEFREAYEAKGEDATIAIIRSRADSFNVYANDSFISELVKTAGLEMPDALTGLEAYAPISLEEIDLLSSDYLFVMARDEDEAEAFLDAREGPLWQFLPAVEQDQAYQVNWSVWVAGWNVAGAHLVIDDLFYYLLDGASSPTPKPDPIQNLISEGYGPEYDVQRFSGN